MKRLARSIRSITPLSLRKTIHRVGTFFGADTELVTRYDAVAHDESVPQFPSIEGALRTLRQHGMRPNFCVDVGAYQGEYTQLFKAIFPAARVLMIEAQDAKLARLRQVAALYPPDVDIEMCLLGSSDGQPVQFTEMETGSSVYAESSPYPRTTTQKTTRSLDTLLSEKGYPCVDFLKLDVQGYELEILRGASTSLRQAAAVLMEASLIPVNAGCPLIADVIAHMNASGFRLFDFCSQIRRRDGVLWQTDLLFLKVDSPVLPKASLTHENWV
jgi:FkbM family methyltransferase